MKNIIAGVSTLIVVGLMGWTYSQGGAYQGGSHNKVIDNFGNSNVVKMQKSSTNSTNSTQTKNDKQNDELLSLKDKAGNAGAFEVSQNYKSKCSSCHGVNGSGFQNGKPMMGPKIIGQSEDVIYQDLLDFKAGRKENVVMKGLLLKIEEPELRELAKEIATFASKLEKLNQK